MLEVRGLTVRRAEAPVVCDLDFDVRQGQFLAIAGRNGAGKSSVLRALTGEWRSSGLIRIDGRELTDWSRPRLARAMAVLPQHATLGFDFTVQQVVEMGRIPHRDQRQEANRRAVDSVIDRLALQPFRQRSYLSLSGGERQRVQFARAIAQLTEPGAAVQRLLLLDEPTSALDLAQQRSLLDLCRDLCREHVAVLAVLHDLNLVARYADRVLLLKDGRRLEEGTPQRIIRADLLERAFDCAVHVETSALDGRPSVLVRPGAGNAA